VRCFRQKIDVSTLARDHGNSRATGYHYLDEVIAVLTVQAPDLHDVLRQAKQGGVTHLILDSTLFTSDRLSEQTTSVKSERIDALAPLAVPGSRGHTMGSPQQAPTIHGQHFAGHP
jgi:hypothetical protein